MDNWRDLRSKEMNLGVAQALFDSEMIMPAVQVYFEHIFILRCDLSFGKCGGLRSGKLEEGVGMKWKKMGKGRWMGPQAIRPDSTRRN